MKTTIYAFLFLVVSGNCIAQTAEDFYKEGMRRITEKNYAEAEKYFTKAIGANKDSAKYYLQRGKVDYALGKFQEAYNDYTYTLALDKNNVAAYLLRADLLLNANKPYESIKDANMAIMLTTVDSIKKAGFINNGVARSSVRDFDGAYKDLMKALTYDSLDPAIYNDLGNIFDEQGDTGKAIMYNLKSYKLDTSFMPALSNIGFIRSKAGNYKDAIPYFDLVLKRHPDMAFVYNNRGYAKLKMGDLDGAMDDINKSIKLLPSNSYAFRNRALIYIEQKKNKKACADLNKAQELGFEQMYGDEVKKLLKQYCQ